MKTFDNGAQIFYVKKDFTSIHGKFCHLSINIHILN